MFLLFRVLILPEAAPAPHQVNIIVVVAAVVKS